MRPHQRRLGGGGHLGDHFWKRADLFLGFSSKKGRQLLAVTPLLRNEPKTLPFAANVGKRRQKDARRWRRRPGLVLGAQLHRARPEGHEADPVRGYSSSVREIAACSEDESRNCFMLSAVSARSAAMMSEHDDAMN